MSEIPKQTVKKFGEKNICKIMFSISSKVMRTKKEMDKQQRIIEKRIPESPVIELDA